MSIFIEKYHSAILCVILILYLINTAYIGSMNLSFTLFILVIFLQLIRLRKEIRKLSLIQILAMLGTILGGIVLLVLFFMGINQFITKTSFPDWGIIVLQITLIIAFLIGVTTSIRTMYVRFTNKPV
jgi:hypothetical protein